MTIFTKSLFYDKIEDWALNTKSDAELGRKIKRFVYKNLGIRKRKRNKRTIFTIQF